jgi:hypothetical protein
MDLLTVVMHELGHVGGLDDDYSASGHGDVMAGWLLEGERQLPGAASEAETAVLASPSGSWEMVLPHPDILLF